MEGRRIIVKLVPSRIRRLIKDLLGVEALGGRIAALEKQIKVADAAHKQFIDGFIERVETDVLSLQRRVDQIEGRVYGAEKELEELEIARGYFNAIEYRDNKLEISGWLMLLERGFDSVALYINQVEVAYSRISESEYLLKYFPFISHANKSGFSFSVRWQAEEMQGMIDICVVGLSNGRKIAKMETWYSNDLSSSFPVPPSHLMIRDCNTDIFAFNLLTGLKSYREFWTVACKHLKASSIKSMLDWGCGYGRVTGFFSRLSGILKICGCDVDAEAIAWAQRNIKSAEFSVVPFYPPTPYPDGAFDLVVSYSVFSHLAKEDQASWLKEIGRVMVPGGLFLASVQGESATSFKFPGRKAEDVLMDGIYDRVEDDALNGVAPKGYYRAVFQTREYTLKKYSHYFDIVDYIVRGALNYQDMVVMRKRK